jgi:L-ascorbate metabolism protein UlaG (beta-lactamase superfamily)
MNRRSFFKRGAALTLGGSLAATGALALTPARNRYYSGPPGPNFDGTRFFNPGGSPPKGFADLMRWQFGGTRQPWPDQVGVTLTKPAPRVDDLTITMVGHATLLIQIAGLNLLTDPVWSDRASPFAFAGPKRVTAPGIALADLPPIDAILLTHNHYDHLDLSTLARLHLAHDPLVITPLGNDTIVKDAIPGLRTTTGNWGAVHRLGPARIHFEPCHHWSARGARDRSMALWSAFMIDTPVGRVFHIGDTGFDQGRPYRDLAQKHGPIRAAILPVGAYEPRWFMRDQHQNPDEAVEGFALSGAAHAICHHCGTFQLTDEGRDATPLALAAALAKRSINPNRFRALQPGEAWAIPPL